jgi:hypothetical protein
MLMVALATALFCGSVIADDGNMGDGGRTGCDGTNPPSTCDCNVPNPPSTCNPNTGGFANAQSTNESTSYFDYTIVEIVGDAVLSAF